MGSNEQFFDESSEQSIIKAAIVSDYFWAWAKVILGATKNSKDAKIAYIDLFAGPGRYKDGTKSTPLLVLETAINDPKMGERLITIFNDGNADNSRSLEEAIGALPGIETLRYRPDVRNEEVGEEIVGMFEEMRSVPTLFFVDPWGYKGLTLRLINSVLKNWGCDCIVFFNYNRINMGLTNQAVEAHMSALFGWERAANLRQRIASMESDEREVAIVEELAEALKDLGGKYVLPFCFKNESGSRTSHHLIFVTKDFKGYEIMKSIMASRSTLADQGVPSFTYNPADQKYPLLFELSRPLDDLREMLLKDFAGRREIKFRALYVEHSLDRSYIARNYKDALLKLEAEGKITVEPPAHLRRKLKGQPTFGDNVEITFPRET
ncbi:MAG: three-Cys-motif partner protein TcmP [Acidobacteriota bacterium]|nr:three-Cys-motif partner protein TcmP [Acidobacteriota bacterium]